MRSVVTTGRTPPLPPAAAASPDLDLETPNSVLVRGAGPALNSILCGGKCTATDSFIAVIYISYPVIILGYNFQRQSTCKCLLSQVFLF